MQQHDTFPVASKNSSRTHAGPQTGSFKEPARTRSPFGLETAIERLSGLKVSSSEGGLGMGADGSEKAKVLKGREIIKLWRSSPSMLLARRSKQNMQPFLNIEADILDNDDSSENEADKEVTTPDAPMAPRNSWNKQNSLPVFISLAWTHDGQDEMPREICTSA
eukprot:CAMPEP_0184287796 /NCGR_PEP_ID=MMETSP1049-20130417/191_1 /TAXON_ID=77928 /ORGANISM="Proteomonas sulcata, Strain CCMP704" /LENGTH=163 /DNA_ID=CAMNT_0026593865 /DNA_START=766 /DNA_END=1257 /DNA_ORIENTATION=-